MAFVRERTRTAFGVLPLNKLARADVAAWVNAMADAGAHERRDQAARYLAESGLHVSQIAVLLGYSEQSALNRSCRRWFGKTPRQYRADLPLSTLSAPR